MIHNNTQKESCVFIMSINKIINLVSLWLHFSRPLSVDSLHKTMCFEKLQFFYFRPTDCMKSAREKSAIQGINRPWPYEREQWFCRNTPRHRKRTKIKSLDFAFPLSDNKHFCFHTTSGTWRQISKCINLSQGKYYWRLNYQAAHPSQSKAIECQPQEEIREAHTENPITSSSNPQFFWHQNNWVFLKINCSFSFQNQEESLSFIPCRNYKCH